MALHLRLKAQILRAVPLQRTVHCIPCMHAAASLQGGIALLQLVHLPVVGASVHYLL